MKQVWKRHGPRHWDRHIDLTGQRFDKLTVIEFSGIREKPPKAALWICRCDCGTVTGPRLAGGLKAPGPKSCGYRNRDDLLSQRFGMLTVIEYRGVRAGKTEWICRCDCGNVTQPIPAGSLKSGNTASCGCQKNLTQKLVYDWVKTEFPQYIWEWEFKIGKEPSRRRRGQSVDIACPELRLAIEVDGVQHHQAWNFDRGDPTKLLKRQANDRRKEATLAATEWHLIRIPQASYLKNPAPWQGLVSEQLTVAERRSATQRS